MMSFKYCNMQTTGSLLWQIPKLNKNNNILCYSAFLSEKKKTTKKKQKKKKKKEHCDGRDKLYFTTCLVYEIEQRFIILLTGYQLPV